MRHDIEMALKNYNIKTFGNVKGIEQIERSLWDNETVLYISPTNAIIYTTNTKNKEKLPGVFAVTTQRVLFRYKALFDEKQEMFDLSDVSAVNCFGNGLTGGHVEIHTLTKTMDFLVTYKKEVMQEIQNLIQKAVQNKKNPPIQSSLSEADEIVKYKKLLDDGVITQEEFEAKKKQLLGL